MQYEIAENRVLPTITFCTVTDLFVWVVNGESTLMRREKAFFEQVAAKLAKPNILVVVNR